MLSVVRRSRLGVLASMASVAFMVALVCPCVSPPARAASGPVSYTHLTLPTN